MCDCEDGGEAVDPAKSTNILQNQSSFLPFHTSSWQVCNS